MGYEPMRKCVKKVLEMEGLDTSVVCHTRGIGAKTILRNGAARDATRAGGRWSNRKRDVFDLHYANELPWDVLAAGAPSLRGPARSERPPSHPARPAPPAASHRPQPARPRRPRLRAWRRRRRH